jgi:glycosyltransferase involved in cell wall biosynthesis
MKLLWVKTDFLHPTTRGGQIRTLEMLRRLHRNHEVHYVAFDNPAQPEGLARSSEYCAKAYPVTHRVPAKTSPAFALQLIGGLFSRLPVAVSRYQSAAMRRQVEALIGLHKFDSVVCDFLFPAPNIPQLDSCVLFQHNVESMIWQRYVEHATGLKRLYFRMQAKRMLEYEGEVCRSVRKVIAVSDGDAETMRRIYRVSQALPVPTGVDLDYFVRPEAGSKLADMVFLGSMDWMPNIDGVVWFVREVLPLIRRHRPDCSLAIVGRRPSPEVIKLAESDPLIQVTGTVPDVRPWLFGALASIVPLRIGGGTRLKIYEAMAAKVPVISTAIGAEGLDVTDGENIYLADTPQNFATRCLALLESDADRQRLSANAWNLVSSSYSWDAATRGMESLLFE